MFSFLFSVVVIVLLLLFFGVLNPMELKLLQVVEQKVRLWKVEGEGIKTKSIECKAS